MSGDAQVTSPGPTARFETFFKLATGVFAAFYVVGLLISNIQLMEVGISDFASLQARNVLIGFLFALYVVAVIIATIPLLLLVAGIMLVLKLRKKRKLILLGLLAGTAFGTGLLALAAIYNLGMVAGFFLVWGVPYEFWSQKPSWFLDRLVLTFVETAYSQFAEVFLFKKTLTVMTVVSFLAIYVLDPFIKFVAAFATAEDGRMSWKEVRAELRSELMFLGPFAALLCLPLLIFGYANDVYPNFKYNLGGGQPDIAELVLSGRKAELAGIKADNICCAGDQYTIYEAKQIGPVVIWLQGDKYFYLSNLSNVGKKGPAELTAVDVKLVRSVRYLPSHVKISAGSQLVSVH